MQILSKSFTYIMDPKIGFITAFLIYFSVNPLLSQFTIEPPEFNPSSDITIYFDASKGNKALENFNGDVYLHTGIIQGSVLSPSGWTYVQGNWGVGEERLKMEKTAPNKYQKVINIHEYYGIPLDEEILQIAMVFRDEKGSIVAKTSDDQDFYFPELEILEHGKIEKLKDVRGQSIGEIKSVHRSEDGKTLHLDGETQRISISLIKAGILNIRYYPIDKEERKSIATILEGNEVLDYKDHVNVIEVSLDGQFSLQIIKGSNVLILENNGKLLFQIGGFNFTQEFEGQGPYSFFKLPLEGDEHIYGLGSRALPIDRVGERLYVYNKPNYNYKFGEDDVYLSLPYFLSSKGYGLFLDSYRKSVFDIGKYDKQTIEIGTKEDHCSIYIFYGKDEKAISKKLSDLTGYQELPPIWALGYFQSRYGYRSQQEVENVVAKTLEEGYPLDATVLDLYWFGGTSRMGDFDWDRDSFPDPDGLISGLEEKGVKTILITESYVVEETDYFNELDSLGYFALDENGNSYVIRSFWVGPAALIDVFVPGVSDWLWKIYKREFERGAAAWWCDSGEPENHPQEMIHANGTAEEIHNAYALRWAEIFYENFRKDYPSRRLLNLTRSGYPGMQRFNTIPWSGDVSRTWSALRAQVPIMIGTGLSGVPYIHHDIGGFTGSVLDEELYTRWIQLGVFSPVMRVHGDGHMIAPEPIFYSSSTQEIVRENIKLRYELLPYNYTLSYEASKEGKPLLRPMFYHYPNDAIADTLNSQFLWGESILIAPVMDKGKTEKLVYFANDHWYDFYSKNSIKNQNWTTVPAPLARIPVFVKAGSFIIKTGQDIQNTTAYNPAVLDLNYYYASEPSQSHLYIDDGKTHQEAPGYVFQHWIFTKEEDNKWITFNFENKGTDLGKNKSWTFELINLPGKLDCVDIPEKRLRRGKDYEVDMMTKSIKVQLENGRDKFQIRIRK